MKRLILGLLLALCLPLVGCDDDGDLVPAVAPGGAPFARVRPLTENL